MTKLYHGDQLLQSIFYGGVFLNNSQPFSLVLSNKFGPETLITDPKPQRQYHLAFIEVKHPTYFPPTPHAGDRLANRLKAHRGYGRTKGAESVVATARSSSSARIEYARAEEWARDANYF